VLDPGHMLKESSALDPLGDQVLAGIRVVDLGHALAGPFAATMLGDFGAEVIKIEPPGTGDPMRRLGPRKKGVPLWWKAAGRNKKSVTLDFRNKAGRDILLAIVRSSDVLVENFRPGTLEKYGLGWDELSRENARLVMLRISGFGQSGPTARRPGFGRIAEAMSGAAQLTGDPNGPPVHVGYSLADTLSGLMGAYGILLALLGRQRTGAGECIDLALYEPLFRLIDWQVIAYEQLGILPVRAGNGFPVVLEGVAAGVARTSDGIWMSYSAATDSVLVRLIEMIYEEPVTAMENFATADKRRLRCRDVEAALDEWIAARTAGEVEIEFAKHEAVIGRVYDMDTIWADPTYRARDDIVKVADDDFGTVSMHGVLPKLLGRPGRVRAAGEGLGAHTAEVLREFAGVDEEALAELRRQGVV
jgi:crotonobetainyl-CoA:carnitine CoA-transferase CaiB-like acyl-CoA transferase